LVTAQPTTGPVEAATPTGGEVETGPFRTYRVQPGDTLRFIAATFGVSAASIAQASGIQNPDQLRPGQVLTIPRQTGYLYRLAPGETLDQVAARTGVSIELILSASALRAEQVKPGEVVLIPDLSSAHPSK
jgi:LysM repeat protein